MVTDKNLISFFRICTSSFPSTICWRGYLYSTVWSEHCCQRLARCMRINFWIISCCCPCASVYWFFAAPHCFNYCSFVVCFEVRYYDASCLTFLFRLALAILGSFVILFYYIILTILEQGILFDFFNVPDDFFHQCLIIFIMEIIFCVYG